MNADRPLTKILSWIVTLVLLATSAISQSASPQFPNPGNPGISRDQQRQLGLHAAAQVYQQMPVLPDSSPQTQYVRQLGEKLVATIPSQYSWPFEFHVLAQKEVNAFALPGGPMFVNLGTITAASNEAELAGVMAHEMAHVYMQHSAKQAAKSQNLSMWADLAGALLSATTGGWIAQLSQMGLQVGSGLISQRFSRDDESQADAVGAIILYRAGYNPQALANFFQKLGAEGGQPPQILSDHPNPGNREQAIEKEIRFWPSKNYQTNTAAFQRVQKQSAGVRAYTAEEIVRGAKSGHWAALNQKNGAVFKGLTGSSAPLSASRLQTVLPSQRLIAADLGRMTIVRPDNWQVKLPQQQGDFLTIGPPNGVTSGHVGYGVLINGVVSPNGQPANIDELTDQLVQELVKSNRVQSGGKTQPVTVDGVQGRSVSLQSTSPFPDANGQQQAERDWLVTVPQRDASFIFFVFVAPESDFSRFQPTYEAMLKSVKF